MQQKEIPCVLPLEQKTELQKLKILFLLRKVKINAAGKCPIMCRITIDGTRANDFASGQSIDPSNWSQRFQTSTNPNTNLFLEHLRTQINHKYFELINANGCTNAHQVKEYLYKKTANTISFAELVKLYISDLELHIDKLGYMNYATFKKYQNLLQNILKFVDTQNAKLMAADFKLQEIESLKLYLLNKGYNQNYVNRHLKFMKQLYRWALLNEHLSSSPIIYIKIIANKKQDPIFITTEEMQLIHSHKFASERLQQVADCFLFQCHTGVAYADISAINAQSISVTSDIEIITYHRFKTDIKAILPLSNCAKNILNKYEYHLPVLTNQKYNAYLKEIADIVGIYKNLTTHVGRKTFTNCMINEHIFSIDTVAKMLGHSNTKTTLAHYGSVGENRLINEMKGKQMGML